MKKKELLIPVGNKESLYMAVNNGADAVYLAYKKFGARSYANNFTKEELVDAIKYCHLYGVKIYITVNTIIYDSEVDEFLEYIDFLYKNNVDALIIQDIGMIKLIRENYKDIELHASTQMHNITEEDCKLLESLGVKRVVFARELDIDTINNINTTLEKEVFIHGALCVCYSGCCLFSSRKTSRSANRGECIASCRLPYKIYEGNKLIDNKNKYLLSTKELNTIDDLDLILKSNIDSLKIEGRMKSAYYVGFITKLYREAIDNFYEGIDYKITEERLNELKSLYNREFTKGFILKSTDNMNIKSPNHKGYYIGEVIEFDSKKIKIKLKDDLVQEDAIRFSNSNTGMIINKLYNSKGLLVNRIEKNNIAIVDNKINLNKKDTVYKTISKELINKLDKIDIRRIPINIELTCKVGIPLTLKFSDLDGNVVVEQGNIVEVAKTTSISSDNLEKQIIKLGNTEFFCNDIKIDFDENAFVPNKYLNELRRSLSAKLKDIRENKQINNSFDRLNITRRIIPKEKLNLNVLVRNEEQLNSVLKLGVDNIYIDDYSLYKKYKSRNVYYALPRIIDKYEDYINENLLVRELGSIYKYSKNNNLISDYTLNVSNKNSFELLNDLGINRVCTSIESRLNEINYDDYNKEIIVYGKPELMVSKYNIADKTLTEDVIYYLEDDKFRKYKTVKHNGITTIYDSDNIDFIKDINKIKKHFNNIRIDFLDEDEEQIIKVIEEVRKYL